MVTIKDTIRKMRKLALSGAVSVLAANSAFGGLCCCDPPRAYYSPACEPAWGYHQTCWRRFPPLEPCTGWGDYCPTCQTDDSMQYADAWQQPVQGQMVAPTAPSPSYLQGTPLQGNVIYQNAPAQAAPMSSMQIPSAGGMQMTPYNTSPTPYYGGAPAATQPGPGAPIPMNGNAAAPGNNAPQKQVQPSPVSPGTSNPYPSNTAPMPMDDNELPMPTPIGGDGQSQIYMMPNGYAQPTAHQTAPQKMNFGGHPIQPARATQVAQPPQQMYGNPQLGSAGQSFPANGTWTQPPTNQVPGNVQVGNAGPFRSVSFGQPVAQPQPIQQQAAPVEVKRSLWQRLTGK